MDRTSETNLRASSMGRRLSNAVSDGSANQDLIGMALSAIKIIKVSSQQLFTNVEEVQKKRKFSDVWTHHKAPKEAALNF